MKRLCLFLPFVLAMLTAPSQTWGASVLFSNFAASYGYNTSQGNVAGNGFDGNTYAEGDAFTPSMSANLASIDIALSCFFTCTDNFTVALTSSVGGQPGAAIETFTVSGASLGSLGNTNPPVTVTSVLRPLLSAGTQYWVTVSSDLNNSIEWNLNSTGDASPAALSIDGGATWFSPSGQTPGAFDVNGAAASSAPEPATSGFLIFALILILIARGVPRGLSSHQMAAAWFCECAARNPRRGTTQKK